VITVSSPFRDVVGGTEVSLTDFAMATGGISDANVVFSAILKQFFLNILACIEQLHPLLHHHYVPLRCSEL
jgi:hypothetical protein